ESARVPLIVSVPGLGSAGQASSRVVELLDLYPTLADLGGLVPPKGLQGATLRPLLENPNALWSRPAFTQVQRGEVPGHSVRTERARYTQWDFGGKGEELYDHNIDPQELHNLAADPSYAALVTEMKALLKQAHPTKVAGGVATPDTRKKF